MPSIAVKGVTVKGPLLDKAQSLRLLAAMVKDIDKALAQAGVNLVQLQLDKNLKHPTGFYRKHIVTDLSKKQAAYVTDSGVIYGPWLEGTGSRNQSTRFKGYSSFRKATKQLNDASELITSRVVERYVRLFNG